MRFTAAGRSSRMKLQVSIEANNPDQAQIAAEKWAKHNRVERYAVWVDHPVIKVVDNQILITDSILGDNYIPFPGES